MSPDYISQIVLFLLHSTSVLLFYIDVVLTLSICIKINLIRRREVKSNSTSNQFIVCVLKADYFDHPNWKLFPYNISHWADIIHVYRCSLLIKLEFLAGNGEPLSSRLIGFFQLRRFYRFMQVYHDTRMNSTNIYPSKHIFHTILAMRFEQLSTFDIMNTFTNVTLCSIKCIELLALSCFGCVK